MIIVLILVMAVVMAVLLVIPTMHRASYVTIGLVKVPTNAPRIIVSSVFNNGSQIPINYTCNGLDYSIPLYINDVPSNAKSLVIIMEDLNAASGVFIHWVLYDVPPNITELPQAFRPSTTCLALVTRALMILVRLVMAGHAHRPVLRMST